MSIFNSSPYGNPYAAPPQGNPYMRPPPQINPYAQQSSFHSSTTTNVQRLREFQAQTAQMSMLTRMQHVGAMPSMQVGALQMFGMSNRAARNMAGFAAPKNMDAVDFKRFTQQAYNRSSEDFKHQWFRSPGAFAGQLGRTVSKLTGTNEFYENTLGRLDKEARSASRAANQMTGALESIVDRSDLVDQDHGRGLKGRTMAQQIGDIMADPEKLKNLVSKSEMRRFRKTGGTSSLFDFLDPKRQEFFSAEEQAQILNKAAERGEFDDIQGTVRDSKGNIRIAETDTDRKSIQRELGEKIAIRARKITANVSDVQKRMGTKDTAEAMDLLGAIAGERGMEKIDENTIRNLKKMKDDLKLTNKGIAQVFEAGRDLAKQYGLSASTGTGITMGTKMLARDMQKYGITDKKFIGQYGAKRLNREITKNQVSFAKSDQGEMSRAFEVAMIQLRSQGKEGKAAEFEKEMTEFRQTQGFVDVTVLTKAMNEVTGASTYDAHTAMLAAGQDDSKNAEILERAGKSGVAWKKKTRDSVTKALKDLSGNSWQLQVERVAELTGLDKQVAAKLAMAAKREQEFGGKGFSNLLDDVGATGKVNIAAKVKKISEKSITKAKKREEVAALIKDRKLVKAGYDPQVIQELLDKYDDGDKDVTDDDAAAAEFIKKKSEWEKESYFGQAIVGTARLLGSAAGGVVKAAGYWAGKDWTGESARKSVGAAAAGKAWHRYQKHVKDDEAEAEKAEAIRDKREIIFSGKGKGKYRKERAERLGRIRDKLRDTGLLHVSKADRKLYETRVPLTNDERKMFQEEKIRNQNTGAAKEKDKAATKAVEESSVSLKSIDTNIQQLLKDRGQIPDSWTKGTGFDRSKPINIPNRR